MQRVVREHLGPDGLASAMRGAADAVLAVWPEHDAEPVLAQTLRDCTHTLRRHAEHVLWSPDGHPVLFRAARNRGYITRLSHFCQVSR
jgi:hypothetical protein